MLEKFKVIDLFSGFGGRALGFQQAGYDVVCTVENNPVYNEIRSKIINSETSIQADIETIKTTDLPDADVIVAKVIMSEFYKSGKDGFNLSINNDAIFKIIFEKLPKAFVLEIPTRMITNSKALQFRAIFEMPVFQKYYISYRIMKEADYSGFPVSGSQAYMVGIRNDLRDNEFYFPNGDLGDCAMFQEDAQLIDEWYRKITFTPESRLQKDTFYIRNFRNKEKISESKIIQMGAVRDLYLTDSLGLRRITHNECAALKGLKKYDFNKCRNKHDMYEKLAGASNVFLSYAVAAALKQYLQYYDSIPLAEDNIKEQNLLKNPTKTERLKNHQNTPEDIIYPKHKLVNIHVDRLKGIKNLDIKIDKNLTAIMGVNGAGKSTILHALACVYRPYKSGENYKFSFFFTPNPDSSWINSRLSITYWDENLQKEITRDYRKVTDRWAPRYADRPARDVYFIGIETCIPEIERERQTSYIDYKTSQASDKISCKVIKSAAYILNKNYDCLNYHKTKKKDLLGVCTKDDMRYSSLSMGAGEQRVLMILRTVYTANTYALILIDEIDILLHVMALKRLIQMLSEIAVQKNLQIIFTTHSMEMNRLQKFVDIRYLEPLKEKTMVYDTITSDIVYELSEKVERRIKIYVEDILAQTIVNVVTEDLGMSRNVEVVQIGAVGNAFALASSLILQNENTDRMIILLDGDVYRDKNAKCEAVKKRLTGTEINHEDKVKQAVELICQLSLPEKTEPEKYIFDLLSDLNANNEIVEVAKTIKAVSDSHQWLDDLVTRMGGSEELLLYKILHLVSEHENWGTYVEELHGWLIKQKEI